MWAVPMERGSIDVFIYFPQLWLVSGEGHEAMEA
jgi:hypothetical protein